MRLPNDEYSHLDIPDAQMFRLISLLKARGVIRFRQEFCDEIDIHKQLIRNIKLGSQHFTVTHILNACKTYGVNANWIYGLEKETFRRAQHTSQNSKTLLDNLVLTTDSEAPAANRNANKTAKKSRI